MQWYIILVIDENCVFVFKYCCLSKNCMPRMNMWDNWVQKCVCLILRLLMNEYIWMNVPINMIHMFKNKLRQNAYDVYITNIVLNYLYYSILNYSIYE